MIRHIAALKYWAAMYVLEQFIGSAYESGCLIGYNGMDLLE